ncbi:glycerate kinase [Thiomicrorhabdus immobilis]|uniref:Glycerate kinase n=1 Tax=Thiomicrorhabdus immobilis TaxID=2791037 RepID=A0ABN6CVC2_9GAMM|nr:glycerate kinase [Thiomicrorhabdus immobilis]BCN92484.1 glycerate kinase [Thiomicrorhabdus immobilis]
MSTYLIAPDSFKGSLDASQFCEIATQVIHNFDPNAVVFSRPMSDGGEGFVESFTFADAGEEKSIWVAGPLGKKVKAKFAWQADTQTAIVEMAQASGITKIPRPDLNPLNTHTYGTGQIIQAAIDLGAKKIILGLGGSATNDGGVGALMALGVPLLDSKDQPINLGGAALKNLAKIGEIPTHLLDIEWEIACDVTNPLLGEHGATYVFGPQKGAQTAQLELLEKALENYAQILEKHTGKPVHLEAGSGAAGGMAAGFMGLLNAKLTPGFDVINATLKLDELLANEKIDYIFTGEGRFDSQTRFGKLPLRIAELGNQHNVPTIGICGSLTCSVDDLPEFKAIFSIVNKIMNEFEAMGNAPYLLQQTLYSVMRILK